MQCPHDEISLKLIDKNNAYGYHCADCEGVFLHGKAVAMFKHNYQTDIQLLFDKKSKPQKTTMPCPACQHLLVMKKIDGVELDCCEYCSGIWFDADELQQIIRKHGSQPTSSWEAILDLLSFLPFPGGGSC